MSEIILIVEDELIIARHIKEILDKEGYKAFDGVKTVKLAKEKIQELKPSLVLIDINLGGYNEGVELGHYVQGLNTIPFMYITSFSDKQTVDAAKATRPNGYIVKPFKTVDIITSVSIVLNNFRFQAIDIGAREAQDLNTDVPFQIKKTIQYIQDHLSEQISINELAKTTPWAPGHFTRLFSKSMGMSPYQFIIDLKIRKAMVLAETTDLLAADISFELGFVTYSSFTKNFKRISGHTFASYRNICKIKKHL